MRIACTAVAVFALSAIALCDTICLTNGAVLEGRILGERDREIVLKLDSGGVLTLKKAMVKEIRRPGKGTQTFASQEKKGTPPATKAEATNEPAPPPSIEHKGPGWSIELPLAFVPHNEAGAPSHTRRFRDPATEATVCVTADPEPPGLEGKRRRPVWALSTMADEVQGKLLSRKRIAIGGRPASRTEVALDIGELHFRETWTSIEAEQAHLVCACPEDLSERYAPIFERCVQSFRIEREPARKATEAGKGQ